MPIWLKMNFDFYKSPNQIQMDRIIEKETKSHDEKIIRFLWVSCVGENFMPVSVSFISIFAWIWGDGFLIILIHLFYFLSMIFAKWHCVNHMLLRKCVFSTFSFHLHLPIFACHFFLFLILDYEIGLLLYYLSIAWFKVIWTVLTLVCM